MQSLMIVRQAVSGELKQTVNRQIRASNAVVVVAASPLMINGGIAEDHGDPEARKLFRAWIESRRERQRVAKQRAAQRVCSWIVQE